MRVKPRNWTQAEIALIKNTFYSTRELSDMLSARPGTIKHMRHKLGVILPMGAKKGKPNLKNLRQITKQCIGKECSNTFTVNQASKKKFCSHSCQQRTQNVAAKGIGSRKMRNPLTPEYKRYARRVHGLSQKTYEKNKHIINPTNVPRTLCGVEGGWQLDHIIPIKECFARGMTPEQASTINNLRMLPWKENLMRQYEHRYQ